MNNGINKEIKRYLETNENETTITPKSMGHSKSSPKREMHSITGQSQEVRNISNKPSNFTLKETWGGEQTKPKVSRRDKIVSIRAEINKISLK